MDNKDIISEPNSRKWGFISIVFGLTVFFVFNFLGFPGRAGFTAAFTAVLVFVIRFRWGLRGRRSFWGLIGVLASAHSVIVFSLPWSNWHYPGAIFIPIVFLDFVVYAVAIFVAEKLFRPSTPS
jgi:membrane protease YdiL (CAAX protease family)